MREILSIVLSIFGGTTERSRRKSSPAASDCSLTRTSTTSVLPIPNTMLDRKLTGPAVEIHVGQCRTVQSRAPVLRPQSS
jgi:hypothetical protein